MRTSAGPWYRTSRDAWYVQLNGKQVMLARGKQNRAEARRVWLALMNGETVEARFKLADCFAAYLAQTRPPSYKSRKSILDHFLAHVGDNRLACDLKTFEVERYIKPTWKDSTKRTHIKTIAAALAYAVRMGKLSKNPLAGMKAPGWQRRRDVMSADELDRLVAAARGPFSPLIRAMVATGCRPGEICGLQVGACNLEAGTWTVKNKTRAKTGEETRTIYLTDEVVAICRERIGSRTEGAVFLNARKRPWTSDSIRLRFAAIRDKLGLSAGVIPYATRHRYASDAINKHGMDSLVVAKLMGHANPMMLMRTYYHEDLATMRAAANRAVGHRPEPVGGSDANAGEGEPDLTSDA